MLRLICLFGGLALGLTSMATAQDPFGDISSLKLAKAEDKVDVPGTPAPPGATVLFDGRSLDAWQNRNGQDKANWTLVDGGILEVNIWLLPRKDDGTANLEPKLNTGAAVKAAVAYLSRQQQADGSWKFDSGHQDGVSALCTLALLNGGVEIQDERAQRALRWLRGQEPKLTYSLALQTLVYCRTRAPEDVERIRRNVAWLIEAQAKDGDGKGGWTYVQSSGGRADGSCTRFAIWALDAARHADANIPESVWRSNADYWLNSQLEDGVWAYTPTGKNGTVTMTLAGISCLGVTKTAIADQALHARIDQTIGRAWKRHDQWCKDSQPTYLKSPGFRFYAFQSLGQAATRTGRIKIGDIDWKPSATRLLLAEQQVDSGCWNDPMFGSAQPLVGTSLALLFLTE